MEFTEFNTYAPAREIAARPKRVEEDGEGWEEESGGNELEEEELDEELLDEDTEEEEEVGEY